MNKEQMRKNVGTQVRLLPPACRLDANGLERKRIDDDFWMIEDVSEQGVRISDPRTGHLKLLGYDHIQKFTTDGTKAGARRGFLTLHVQLFVQGNDVKVLPNASPGEPVAPKRHTVLPKLVDSNYPTSSGIQLRLEHSGYELGWGSPERLATLIDLEGWELVIERDGRGILCTFVLRDGSVLVKRRRRNP
jgi:hypothetical protein